MSHWIIYSKDSFKTDDSFTKEQSKWIIKSFIWTICSKMRIHSERKQYCVTLRHAMALLWQHKNWHRDIFAPYLKFWGFKLQFISNPWLFLVSSEKGEAQQRPLLVTWTTFMVLFKHFCSLTLSVPILNTLFVFVLGWTITWNGFMVISAQVFVSVTRRGVRFTGQDIFKKSSLL